MTGFTLFLMIGLSGLILYWLDTATARDLARLKAGTACKDMGVQLLDQTVALRRTRLCRDGAGHLVIERCFRFEFSETGNDRNSGEIRLQKSTVIGIVLDGKSMGRVLIGNQE